MSYPNVSDEISMARILYVLRKNWIIIAALTVLLPALKAVTISKPVAMYKAETFLRIGRAGSRPIETVGEIVALLKASGTLKPLIYDISGKSVTDKDISRVGKSINLSNDGRLIKISVESDSAEFSERLSAGLADKIIKRHVAFYRDANKTLAFLKDKVQLARYPGVPYDLSELSTEPTILEIPTYTFAVEAIHRNSLEMFSTLAIFGFILGVVAAFIKELATGNLLKSDK